MPPIPGQSPRRTYLAAIALLDFHSLGYQGIALPEPRREQLEDVGDIRIQVNVAAQPDAANHHAERIIHNRVVGIMGCRGVEVRVDLAAGMGEVRYTPLFGSQGLLATVTVENTDVLAEVAS